TRRRHDARHAARRALGEEAVVGAEPAPAGAEPVARRHEAQLGSHVESGRRHRRLAPGQHREGAADLAAVAGGKVVMRSKTTKIPAVTPGPSTSSGLAGLHPRRGPVRRFFWIPAFAGMKAIDSPSSIDSPGFSDFERTLMKV